MEDIEIVDINISSNGQVIVADKRTLLIDADTIAYTACLSAESEIDILPRDFYTDDEWNSFTDEEKEEGKAYRGDIKVAISNAVSKLEKIKELTGCEKYELHFTSGKESFRYQIYPAYKANRKEFRAPCNLAEVKQLLASLHNGFIHTEIEADDAVAYLARRYPDDYIVCAVDKDVLRAIPGKHFNYYESAKHNIDMHWVETDNLQAFLFPYRQAIMGDRSDNIIGLQGYGEKKVLKLIPDNANPLEVPELLIKAFESNGRTREDALLNYELCYMGDALRCEDYFDRIKYNGPKEYR